MGSRALMISRGSAVAPLLAPWWRRLVGLPLAGLGVGAVFFLCRGGRRLPVGLGGLGGVVRVGLGRFPAGRSALRWRCGSGVRRLRAGSRATLAAAGPACGVARSARLGAGWLVSAGFVAAATPPPFKGCVTRSAAGWPPLSSIHTGCRTAPASG